MTSLFCSLLNIRLTGHPVEPTFYQPGNRIVYRKNILQSQTSTYTWLEHVTSTSTFFTFIMLVIVLQLIATTSSFASSVKPSSQVKPIPSHNISINNHRSSCDFNSSCLLPISSHYRIHYRRFNNCCPNNYRSPIQSPTFSRTKNQGTGPYLVHRAWINSP